MNYTQTISSVTFGIGIGKDKNGRKLPQKQVKQALREICTKIAGKFGGFNLVKGSGGWVNSKGELIEEASASITAAIIHDIKNPPDGQALIKVELDAESIADEAKLLFNQECVLVTYNYGTSVII